jgi:hypothetical protein
MQGDRKGRPYQSPQNRVGGQKSAQKNGQISVRRRGGETSPPKTAFGFGFKYFDFEPPIIYIE